MTPHLAQLPRGDRAFERLYRRHVADVYRYALVVLRDPDQAEGVTRQTFVDAYRAFARRRPRKTRAWVLALAHRACRERAGSDLDEEDQAAETLVCEECRSFREHADGALPCHEAERAISRRIDGRLAWSERKPLKRHLRECAGCARFARSRRARRSAWRVLAGVPLPPSLQSFFGPGGVMATQFPQMPPLPLPLPPPPKLP
jgi:Putative zinc-finger/Sigma-70 region 2